MAAKILTFSSSGSTVYDKSLPITEVPAEECVTGYNVAETIPQTLPKTYADCLQFSQSSLHDEPLDDVTFSKKLKAITSALDGPSTGDTPCFFLITSIGDPSDTRRPLAISPSALTALYVTLGFEEGYNQLYVNRLFTCFSRWYPDPQGNPSDHPMSVVITLRLPRNSRGISCIIRINLRNYSCVAFLCSPEPERVNNIRTLCKQNAKLLTSHPLHLLALIAGERYRLWSNSFASLWREVAEIEAATGLVRPDWMTTLLRKAAPHRMQELSNTENLLKQIYATNSALCQCKTGMEFAVKFGKFCLEVLDNVETARERMGYAGMAVSKRWELESRIRCYGEMCDAIIAKLAEVKDRLRDLTQGVFGLLSQRDGRINLEQTHILANDSMRMKTIAIVTLVFLPSALVTAIWSAGLFHLDDDVNWKAYLAVTTGLTAVVFFCWRIYVLSFQRQRGRGSHLLVDTGNLDLPDIGSVIDLAV